MLYFTTKTGSKNRTKDSHALFLNSFEIVFPGTPLGICLNIDRVVKL